MPKENHLYKTIRKIWSLPRSFLSVTPTLWSQFAKPDEFLADAKDIHRGERCFIIGMGPSLNKTDLSLIRNEFSFGVNGIYLVDRFSPTYYVMISANFWETHVEGVRNISCRRRFIPRDTKSILKSQVPTSWINFQRPVHRLWRSFIKVPWYFSMRPERIIQGGGTVIFACLQLAYHMGFEEAILLGIDHNYHQKDFVDNTLVVVEEKDSGHFKPDYHPTGTIYHVDLVAMERGYCLAKEVFEKDGRKILNASPGTQLDVFPKIEYQVLF